MTNPRGPRLTDRLLRWLEEIGRHQSLSAVEPCRGCRRADQCTVDVWLQCQVRLSAERQARRGDEASVQRPARPERELVAGS